MIWNTGKPRQSKRSTNNEQPTTNNQQQPLLLLSHPAFVAAGLFSPGNRQVVTVCNDGQLRWWDLDGKLTHQQQAHEGEAEALAISPDGRHLLTGGRDNTARLWTFDGKLLLTFSVTDRNKTGGQRITCVAFSPDGRYLALGSEGGSARIYRLNGQEISTFTVLDQTGVYSLTFTKDSSRLIVGDGKGYLRVVENIDVTGGAVH